MLAVLFYGASPSLVYLAALLLPEELEALLVIEPVEVEAILQVPTLFYLVEGVVVAGKDLRPGARGELKIATLL